MEFNEGRTQHLAVDFASVVRAISQVPGTPEGVGTLRELDRLGVAGAMKVVGTLLAKKGKSPEVFLRELSDAGTITIGKILGAGAKLRELQADSPEIQRGAMSFLIAMEAKKQLDKLGSASLESATLPARE